MPVHALFWPGPAGAETSARFETLLEGIQEGEARIFIEEMLGRKVLPEDLAKRAGQVIFDHLRGTVYIPAGVPATHSCTGVSRRASYWSSPGQDWLTSHT